MGRYDSSAAAPAGQVVRFPRLKSFRTSTPGSFLSHALAMAHAGLAVFPCRPGAKQPLFSREDGGSGHLDATSELWLVEAWWSAHPDANIGVVPGRCNPPLIVLDADCKDGKRGLETLARMEQDGLVPKDAPRVRTPSGGIHVYMRGAEPVSNRSPFKDVDVRSAGGYVLAPPSVLDEGGAYEVLP